MSTVILIATALAVLGLVEALYNVLRYSGERKKADLLRRLRAAREQASANLLREQRVARNRELERVLRQLPFTDTLERLLVQTSLEWTVASMLSFALAAAGVSAAGAYVALGESLLVAGLTGALAASIPFLIAVMSRAKRSASLSEQLPEALDMMSRSLRAGHGLGAAFRLVATEMPAPVAVEFARCAEETNIGVEFRDAVTHITERVPGNLDLKIFAVSVTLQHETGGNLVEILQQISHTIRERFKFQGKLAALTAEARMSGIFLGALPPLTLTYLLATNPGYLSVLKTDPIGPYFILAGLCLWAGGLLWLFRLAQVKY
ncbi:MAG: type II secretion system F family protein [Myxococcales bacterium]